MVEKYPITIIENVYEFERYKTASTKVLNGYAIFQLAVTMAFVLFMFYNFSNIPFEGLILFSGFIFVGIYGYTSVMDRKSSAVWIEVIRGILGISLIVVTNDWFGINSYLSWGGLLVSFYFLVTIFGGIYFTYFEKDTVNTKVIA